MEKDHEKNKNILKRLQDDLKKKEKGFRDAEKEALDYCKGKRIDVTKNSNELYALKMEFEKQKKEFMTSVNGQSYDDIRRRRTHKQRQVRELEEFINCLDKNVNQVSQMVQKRKTFFITMRSRSVRTIGRDFTRQMSMHNLTGTLIPDYTYRKLDVDVRPTNILNKTDPSTGSLLKNSHGNAHDDSEDLDGNIQSSKFSLTSLSGGERSKTLVCLINALWNVQQPPFRCLDEWDVFLDLYARKQIEAMLVETAFETDKQYFFISPQGSIFSEISGTNMIEKYKKSIKVFTIKK